MKDLKGDHTCIGIDKSNWKTSNMDQFVWNQPNTDTYDNPSNSLPDPYRII